MAKGISNTISFFVPGPLPGLNEMIDEARTHWAKSAKTKKMWTEHISNIIGNVPKFEQVHVHYHWIEPNRRRDPGNISGGGRKYIEDGMILAGLISNDGWIQITGFNDTFEVNKKTPGCLVTVTEV